MIEMPAVLVFVLFFAAAAAVSGSPISHFSGSLDSSDGSCIVESGLLPGSLAFATYEDGVNETGWGLLRVSDSGAGGDALSTAFAAGCVEAAATYREMYAYWANYRAAEYGPSGPGTNLTAFMSAQLAWVRASVTDRPGPVPALWDGIAALMAQFDGLVSYFEVYVNSVDPAFAMSELDLYMLNSVGDLEDLNGFLPNGKAPKIVLPGGLERAWMGATQLARRQSHDQRRTESEGGEGPPPFDANMPLRDKLLDCSAAISMLPGAADVTVGHTTWRSYYAMLRVYKVYTLPSVFPAAPRLSFSSSPGLIHSKDDFYATQDLVVMETTNSVFNATLFELYVTPESLFSWQRAYAANGWADGGRAWTAMFALFNSGTYNNQWMAVDARRFTPGVGPDATDFLWIIEQIPGTTAALDVSDVFVRNGFWPSYNIPFIKSIYDASGYPAMEAKYGAAYSYTQCDRALIFARNESQVTDALAMRALLRYNNFATDPLAHGDPISGSISSRGDLRAPSPVAFGGVDTKVISFSSMGGSGELAVLAESGPTHDQQPVFAWANVSSFATIQHALVPAVFDFDTVEFNAPPAGGSSSSQ